MNKKIFIGIDPAFRQNGFAMCVIDEEDTVNFRVFRNGFREFMRWVMDDAPENAIYCVENSNLQDATFDMRGSKGMIAKKSRNVGKNQAISQIVVDTLIEHFGERSVYNISPKQKGKKIEDLKIFATFVAHNGHEDRIDNYRHKKSEQDKRDAYQLAMIAKNKYNRIK